MEGPCSPPANPAPRSTPFPIVGIGASAGGLEALEVFLRHMPPDSGIAFVIVTHMDPQTTSFLPELLRRATRMPVHEATDEQPLRPDEVFVTVPGKYLAVEQATLTVRDMLSAHGIPLPIDAFFRSLAADQQDKAIGIILSGTGTDGTLGAKAIKSVSGMVMVQDAQSARFAGMPCSALATGLVDYVLPPDQMPAELLTYVRGPYLSRSPEPTPPLAIVPEVLQDILSLVYAYTSHSFTSYKVSTIRRRIERRLNLHQITQPEHYVTYLREHPEEIDSLFRELLIGVTTFFRDPDAYAVLASTVLPTLLASKGDGEPVRVWVPGCSTGEEPYSLGIVLQETLEQLRKPCPVQIFATDLDAHAVDTARLGLYPAGIAADVTPERLQRFFTREDATYRIAKEIREMVIFAPHNLLADPPFTHLDLLSCRNLLIYLEANMQHQLITLFHYALRPGGVLFLGASETIGNLGDLFTTLDHHWKIFARSNEATLPYTIPEHTTAPLYPASRPTRSTNEPPQFGTPSSRAEAYLAQRYAPPSVLITAHGDIVHFHGRTGAYLEPPRGQPSFNLFHMAREGLELVLAPVIRAALAQEQPIIRSGVSVKTAGETITTDVVVERIVERGPLQGLLLVSFRPVVTDPAMTVTPGHAPTPPRRRRKVTDLERELQETRASLQSTIEALEVSNEQLSSANEELQSTNEEMQSANEELKTSKEEMQSLNEELQTVNSELRSKIDELSHANDDMTNLLDSTAIATIFLDEHLQIKRYTTRATRVMALIPSDVGRPISDLVSKLDYATLVDDAGEVLRTLSAQEKEVCTKDGSWYLVRILPYRTSDNIVEGLVITFIEIDNVKRAEAGQQRALEQLEAEIQERRRIQERLQLLPKVFMEATIPIILADSDGCITDLNAEAERSYGWRHAELLGQPMTILVPAQYHAQVDALLARCRQGEDLRNVRSVRQRKDGTLVPVRMTVSPLTNEQGAIVGLATIAQHLAVVSQEDDAS